MNYLFFLFGFVLKAEDAEKAKHGLSEFAEEAKTTGASMFDHAKGAATAAIAAGSKSAEDIADEKLKEAESVSFSYPLTYDLQSISLFLRQNYNSFQFSISVFGFRHLMRN